jgi:carotenoid cleavage dioxygenase-like enzyme
MVTGKHEVFSLAHANWCKNACSFPRKGSEDEGDGYVMALLNNYEKMISELVVLDTKDFSERLALVKLP